MKRSPLKVDPAKVAAWKERSRQPLAAVGRKKKAEKPDADRARADVWARDGGRCQYPHDSMPIGCAGPLELCHVIPKDLAPKGLRWHPDNLFVGCHAGNDWTETHTGEAFATGRHGHFWDTVKDGKVVP